MRSLSMWTLFLLERPVLCLKDRLINFISLLFTLTCASVAYVSPLRRPAVSPVPTRQKQCRVSFSNEVQVAEYENKRGVIPLGTEDMQHGVLPDFRLPVCGPQEAERQEVLAKFVKCNHMINYWERRNADDLSTGFFTSRLGVLGVDPEKWVIVDLAQALATVPEIVDEIRARDRHAALKKALHGWPKPSFWRVKLKQMSRRFAHASEQCLDSLKQLFVLLGAVTLKTRSHVDKHDHTENHTEPRGKIRRKGSGKKGREPARLRAG